MSERSIGDDHFPEAVEGGRGSRRLELLGLKEPLAQPASRREFFAKLGDEQYVKMLGYINSVTRKEPIRYDYRGDSRPGSLVTPPPEAKGPLMERTFKVARDILADNRRDNQTALRRAGLTLAGAINYIHPYLDGNGRTGRVMHYLIEFGSERGDHAFNDELYAIIGSLPVYDDWRKALVDKPPREVQRSLAAAIREQNPEDYNTVDPRTAASERVQLFLDAMQGIVDVPVCEDIEYSRHEVMNSDRADTVVIPAGSLSVAELYEREYLDSSAIPQYQPDEVPSGAIRVMKRAVTDLIAVPFEPLGD